ncbi:MAG: hypothetical protein RIS70_1229 [Planctomycetota bacterium]|jgi:nucleoside 2-deoxyribosyltransferase
MIYLATPYSHPDPAIREQRFATVSRVAAELVRAGQHVFSPISHSHPLAIHGIRGDWEFWSAFDRRLLAICDEVVVLMLDGWRESRGVQAEIDLAIEMDLPVRYLSPAMISNASGGDTNISVRPLSQETST